MGIIKKTFKEFTESILESRIPMDIDLPKDITDLSNIFKENGKSLYLVGGAVRDAVAGKTPKDFDVATDATPDEVIEILKGKYRVMEVGKSFGVVVAITPEFPDGIEIATFREEEYRNSDFSGFVEYIKRNKPENYEERLHLFLDMSS